MHPYFEQWLWSRGVAGNSAQSYRSNVRRVEKLYGDLGEHYESGTLDDIIDELSDGIVNAENNQPHGTRLSFHSAYPGRVLNNLRSAVRAYGNFCGEIEAEGGWKGIETESAGNVIRGGGRNNIPWSRPELELHLRDALRAEIEQLESGLEIVDGGSERKVNSGRIDILARDSAGYWVVIEIRSGEVKRETIGPILTYMGEIMEAEETEEVRGILVASSFDESCLVATRMIPNLALHQYDFSFTFEQVTG